MSANDTSVNRAPLTALAIFCFLAGCAAGDMGVMPRGGEAAALPAAAKAFDNSISVWAQFGDFVRTESGIYQGLWLGSDLADVNISYRHYDAALGDTGWAEVDAYRKKCGGFAVNFGFTKDTFLGGYNEYLFDGGFTGALGDKGLVEIGAGYGVEADGSTLSLAVWDMGFKYYASDAVRLCTGWRYRRFWDGGSSLSYHFYGFGLEYLAGEKAPLMLSARYDRQQINNAPIDGESYTLGAAWYAAEWVRLRAGMVMSYGYPARLNTYDLSAGFRLSVTTVLSIGYSRLVLMGGGMDYDAFNCGLDVTF